MSPYELFIKLVRFDQKLDGNLKKREMLKAEIDELNQQIEDSQVSISQFAQVYHNIIKKIQSLELELKSTDEQIKKAQRRLENAANPKEYYSANNEFQQLISKRSHADDSLLEFFNEREVAKKDYDEKLIVYNKFIDETSKIISAKEQIIKVLNEEIDNEIKERPSKLEGFPKEWLEKYNNMRKTVSNPVEAVVNSSCSGCFYPISTVDINALKHNKLISCLNCYRLLYISEQSNES